MSQVPAADPTTRQEDAAASLDCGDDFEPALFPTRYCPTELLASFSLLMAGHGRCVNASMMLGDREYALWQLARAQTLPDAALQRVAQRLFAYFDDPRGWGRTALAGGHLTR